MFRFALTLTSVMFASTVSAATLTQTVTFPGAKANELFDLYMSADGHQTITGFPAKFIGADGGAVDEPTVGDQLLAFCFEPDMCGLSARILDVQKTPAQTTVVLSWWNFGWVSALEKDDYTVEQRGAPDSTVVLTFSDTLSGAQVELVQANVPDYKVRIPNPDGSEEIGPLSQIVNTHWNALYWDGMRRLAGQ